MTSDCLLAIDQGTTSSRAIAHDLDGHPVATAQIALTPSYPQPGWVEQSPGNLWATTERVLVEACDRVAAQDRSIAALGITNQRETVVVWDRRTGVAIHNAIVWQDRRTADHCARLKAAGHEADVTARTGLLLDPYFSATKIAWLLDHVDGARADAEAGHLAFGTVDSWLIWCLTGGRVHATDATNAARTLLFNIHTQDWDDELLELFEVPRAMLPRVEDCAGDFGTASVPQRGLDIPIRGVAGDQHAAMVGQACTRAGMVKSTYGTGCFALMNTGPQPVASDNRLLTTLAYRLDGVPVYALEGAIFAAGAAVQWLRDELGVIASASETERLARAARAADGVYLVPAFTGLGAPHWDPDARGALVGLTRDTGVAELARAALEAVCLQTRDLIDAMEADAGVAVTTLRVDGGMAANAWLLQRLSDLAGVAVECPREIETTALGASYLAGVGQGVWPSLDAVAHHWARAARYEPELDDSARAVIVSGWRDAVRRVLSTT